MCVCVSVCKASDFLRCRLLATACVCAWHARACMIIYHTRIILHTHTVSLSRSLARSLALSLAVCLSLPPSLSPSHVCMNDRTDVHAHTLNSTTPEEHRREGRTRARQQAHGQHYRAHGHAPGATPAPHSHIRAASSLLAAAPVPAAALL